MALLLRLTTLILSFLVLISFSAHADGNDSSGAPERLNVVPAATIEMVASQANAMHTVTKTVSPSDLAKATVTFVEPPPVPSGFAAAGTQDDSPDPFCFDNCFGVSRHLAGSAASDFCTWMGDQAFTNPGDSRSYLWRYTPHGDTFQGPRWTEEGQVLMSIEVLPGTTCEPTVVVDYLPCYQWMMYAIIDKCNTQSEHSKQGGWTVDGCLNYTINPNPKYYPNCDFGSKKARDDAEERIKIAGHSLIRADSSETENEASFSIRSSSSQSPDPTQVFNALDAAVASPSEPPNVFNITGVRDRPEPHCYSSDEKCWPSGRGTLVNAVNWFCNVIGANNDITTSWQPVGDWHYAIQYYPPTWPGALEEGVIEMKVNVLPGQECNPAFIMTFEECYSYFMYEIIDRCDTDFENVKYGGQIAEECVELSINPNPLLWPECQYHDLTR